MKEHSFILQLEERANERKALKNSSLFPLMVMTVGTHPWKIILPLSILFTIILTILLKSDYINFILWLFGGLP